MAKYMFEAKYTVEGVNGLVRDGGTGRRAAVEKMITSVGGRLDAVYFAFGGTDAYVIADLPDNTTAAAVALTVAKSGKSSIKTIVLMTPEEADAATKKTVSYQPPGG